MTSLSKLCQGAARLGRFPEVLATVVTDRMGTLLDSTGDTDAETVGAVHAVSAGALERAGEALGLGPLQRATVAGPKKVCIITVNDDEIVGIYVDPSKPLGAIEKKMEGVLRQ